MDDFQVYLRFVFLIKVIDLLASFIVIVPNDYLEAPGKVLLAKSLQQRIHIVDALVGADHHRDVVALQRRRLAYWHWQTAINGRILQGRQERFSGEHCFHRRTAQIGRSFPDQGRLLELGFRFFD